MKKRFFLLFVLALVFIMSLSFGSVALADTEPTDENAVYASKWKTSTGVKVTKEEGSGAKIKFESSGDSAEYLYYFNTNNSSIVFTISGFPSADGVIAQVKLTAGNETDTISFSKQGEEYKMALGEETAVAVADLQSLNLELKDGKVVVDGTELGESAISKEYAKIKFIAKTSFNAFVKTINDKVDFVNGTFYYGATLNYEEDSFFSRKNAIFGYDYSVNYVAYDTASSLKLILSYKKDGWTEPVKATDATKIRFGSVGNYTVTLSAISEDDPSKTEEGVVIFSEKYTVTASTDDTTVSFIDKTTATDEYQKIEDGINEEIITNYDKYKEDPANNPASYIAIGDNFYYPSVSEIINSKYFDASSLKLTLCYASKTSSDFATTTNKYFEITSMGKYCYFILPTDACNNGFVYNQEFKDAYELKEDGWYKGSDLIIPVFRFEVIDNSPPEVTAGFESKAYIGKTYKVSSITIKATSYNAEYQLYYMSVEDFNEYYQTNGKYFNRDSFKTGDELNTEAYNAELERLVSLGKLVEVKNVKDLQSGEDVADAFDSSTMSFTPKKGHYYLVCSVDSDNGMSDYVITYAISATKKTSSAVFESEWWKHNWKSVVYLGISGVSLVGILLLLFVKPKKKNINRNDEV